MKTCGIFQNYRCDGSLQTQLLDARRVLYSGYGEVKLLQQKYDQTLGALKTRNEDYQKLEQYYNLIIQDLGVVKKEAKDRGDAVSKRLYDYDNRHTARYQAIQEIGAGLQQKLDAENLAIGMFKEQVESFRMEIDTKLTESDTKGESRSKALREHLDQGLQAIPGDMAEKLKTDLKTVSAECARWRKLVWTLGIFSFAAGAAAAFAYVLVSGAL